MTAILNCYARDGMLRFDVQTRIEWGLCTDEDSNVLAFRQWCNRYSLERVGGGVHQAARNRAWAKVSPIE
jgi:hypothetical protein